MDLKGRIGLLALGLLLVVTVATFALADSCPYCGRSYGAAAPGDWARVSALRAQHEANCSARWSSPGSGSGGTSSSWRRQQAEIERQRQIQAAIEAARRAAEEKRRRLEKQAAELRRSWDRREAQMSARLTGVLDVMPVITERTEPPVVTPDDLALPPVTKGVGRHISEPAVPGKRPVVSPEFLRADGRPSGPWTGIVAEPPRKSRTLAGLKDVGELLKDDVVGELVSIFGGERVARARRIYNSERSFVKELAGVLSPETVDSLAYGEGIDAVESKLDRAQLSLFNSLTDSHHDKFMQYNEAFRKVLVGAEYDLTGGQGFTRPAWWPPL